LFSMEKDIGKIKKNDQSDVIIRIDDFGGRKGLTIREFVTSDRYTGFTKAGVRILASDFPKFKEMINSISEADMKEQATESSTSSTKASSDERTKEEDSNDELPDY